MARARNRPDPDAGPLERFAYDLQVLREKSGALDYRSMARRVGCAPSTLSTAAAGKRLPTLETTLAFVCACGGGLEAQAEWTRRWEHVRTELNRQPSGEMAGLSADRGMAGDHTLPDKPTAQENIASGGVASGLIKSERRYGRRMGVLIVCAAAASVITATGLVGANGDHSPRAHIASHGSPRITVSSASPTTATAPTPEPERRHGPLIMIPGRAVDLDSLAPDWAEQAAPGPTSTDVEFDFSDHALTGLRNADMAVLPPGSTGTFSECALEQNYGVALAAHDIRPGRLLCDITSDNRVALLRVTDVQHDAVGTPDQVTFDAVVWVRPHKN
ncbi:helix-turn-helix domain-containing protein [Streptomyces roseochromogenus]|uniref:helix-turn-helix domain-containing protein n=1 Tax=Streptomyces roseochromogenus TaxID=285450 RepID=UPI000AFC1AF3|nr:helix-turn-helix transcriptional regulator [Streptomyces roseochromogenus]